MVTIGLAKGSYFFLDLAVVSIDVALLMVEFFGEAAKLPQLWLVDASCGGLPSTHGWFHGKSQSQKWVRTGGTTIFGISPSMSIS